jgi:DNA repair protein RadC
MTSDDEIIQLALNILTARLKEPGVSLSSPDAVKQFLRLKLASKDHEVFAVLFLDVKNRLIAYEEMFRGTLTHTSVYPRELVKTAMLHNAASVIYSHNHPSGMATPSDADRLLTNAMSKALEMVDVRSLDHIIVAGANTYSFAEHGEL